MYPVSGQFHKLLTNSQRTHFYLLPKPIQVWLIFNELLIDMSSLKKISLKDIAEAAGVSTALVSFVLNGKKKEYRVGEETAQRILKIANEMNYQPNLAAKSLRSGKTKTIGLVVSDISNPFFSQLARVLEDEATKRGYTVLFGSSDEDKDKMTHVVSNLINKGVDGLSLFLVTILRNPSLHL